jgi:hypothetical protein
VQAAGFVVGLAFLAWAAKLAMSSENQAALSKLRDMLRGESGTSTLVMLVLLTLASLALNGLMFWVTSRPLWSATTRSAASDTTASSRLCPRLPLFETLGTNCIATFLSLLPFKLGLLVRSLVHVQRHAMPVSSLLSWFVMFGGMTGATAVVALLAAIVRGKIDFVWAGLVVAGLAVIIVTVMFLAPLAETIARWIASRVPSLRFVVLLAAPAAAIARSPSTFALHALLRLADFATFAARFALLASALGIALSKEHALLLGSSFLLLNAAAPAGSLGFAEMGVAGAGTLLAGLPKEQIVLLSLVTTALQSVVAGLLSIGVWFWLKPLARASRVK